MARLIIITGFMGAGKTTVAAALARRLACAMIDLDGLIEKRDGRTAQRIIDEEGEDSFRQLESRALRAALGTDEVRIIALGGGTWTIAGNRALINEYNPLTVWLDAPFEVCWQRISAGTDDRPLARNREDARRLYGQRLKLYGLASLHVTASEGRRIDNIINEILASYRNSD